MISKPLGVEGVASLADARWPLAPLDPTPLFAQVGKHGYAREELQTELLKSELYRNVFLGDDGQTTAISITIRAEHTDLERRQLIAGIRERAARNRFPTVVAGGPILTHDAAVFVDQDSRTLGWVSTLALVVVIGILFRKVRWVVLPLAVVHVTLVWTKALLWLVEAHLSMVSTTLTALVTVIGVAGVVQVTARYREERERADVAERPAADHVGRRAGGVLGQPDDRGRIRVAAHLVDRAGPQFRDHAVAGLDARLLRHGGPRPGRRHSSAGGRAIRARRRGSGASSACWRRRWTGAWRGRGRWPSWWSSCSC